MNLGFTRWYLIVVVHALSGCGGLGVGALVGSAAAGAFMGSMVGDMVGESRPVDYHHQAEKEFNSGTYDPQLWAKALVLVEGDKTKRYPKYIDLRAAQLEHEKEGSESEPSLTEPFVFSTNISGSDITGIYIAETTASGGGPAISTMRVVKKMNGKLIVLKQTGNTITGSVSSQSNWIKGTREGNIINFYILTGNQINGSWEINADATNLEGKWFTDGGGGASGKWNLTRIE